MNSPNFHEIFASIWPPRDAAALAALTAAFRTEEWSRVADRRHRGRPPGGGSWCHGAPARLVRLEKAVPRGGLFPRTREPVGEPQRRHFGQLGVFSLQQGKLLNCGEGAAVTTNDDALLRRLLSHHTFHTTMANGMVEGFDAVVSRNSRLPNLLGALLLSQLERFEELSRRRQRHMAIFREELAGLPGLRPLLPPPEASDVTGYYVTYHYDPSAMGGRSAADFGSQLNARGIPAFRGHNQPMYWREPYVSGAAPYRRSACKVAEDFGPTRYLNFKHEMFLADERTIRQVAAHVREIAEGS